MVEFAHDFIILFLARRVRPVLAGTAVRAEIGRQVTFSIIAQILQAPPFVNAEFTPTFRYALPF